MYLNKIYIGKVIDIDDPLRIGRCRVRIDFLHGEIADEDVPWAYPAYGNIFGLNGQCGGISIPKVGAIVNVRFDNGDLYSPIYMSIQELGDDVKKFLQKEYEGTNILLYDESEKVKVYYTPGKGIFIENDESSINIKKNGYILITNKFDDSSIELENGNIRVFANTKIDTYAENEIQETSKLIQLNGNKIKLGKSASQSAVLGENLVLLLSIMCSAIDLKPPMSTLCTQTLNSMKSFLTSNTVKVQS